MTRLRILRVQRFYGLSETCAELLAALIYGDSDNG
jgi:hypothetical protein